IFFAPEAPSPARARTWQGGRLGSRRGRCAGRDRLFRSGAIRDGPLSPRMGAGERSLGAAAPGETFRMSLSGAPPQPRAPPGAGAAPRGKARGERGASAPRGLTPPGHIRTPLRNFPDRLSAKADRLVDPHGPALQVAQVVGPVLHGIADGVGCTGRPGVLL